VRIRDVRMSNVLSAKDGVYIFALNSRIPRKSAQGYAGQTGL
jgi:hypothetical protein